MSQEPQDISHDAGPPYARGTCWPIELWRENREIFKELIKDIAIFAVIIISLTAFHEILKLSTLPQESRNILDKVHFYASLIVFIIFSASFIIKVLVFEFRGRIR